MAGIRQTFDKDGNPHANWRYWYIDWRGKRVWKSGTADPIRTQRIADAKELEQERLREEIDLGIRQPPDSAEQAKPLSIADLVTDYLERGTAQGGRGGHPWGEKHADMRKNHLEFWTAQLGLKVVADLEQILPRVEKVLRGLRAKPRKKDAKPTEACGKTKQNYVEALAAFCDWLLDRGYLKHDPLKGIAPFDTTPKTLRRAMTEEELYKFLNGCAPHRRLMYEVAFCTGLRARELRALRAHHLDVERGGLKLEAAWTKNRKEGFQPLPEQLIARLQQAIENKSAHQQYLQFESRNTKYPKAEDALLYVSANTGRDMSLDLIDADVSKTAPGGKLDSTLYVSLTTTL
jgi:site-specific recombinase XerD